MTLSATPDAPAGASYYVDRKDELLAELDRAMERARPAVGPRLGSDDLDAFMAAVRQAYAGLIPQLPYIGGKGNRLTANLVQSAWCLAIYRVLQARGMTLEQTGEILYLAYAAQVQAYPRWLRLLLGRYAMSFRNQRRTQRGAWMSRQRRYDGDWFYDLIPGDGQNLIYGIDYTECGIVKFLRAQGAAELGPTLCRLDYAKCDELGLHLVRTQTIAEGAESCDFRFMRERRQAGAAGEVSG